MLDSGGETEAAIARIAVDEGPARPVEIDPPEPAAGPFVAVCMATFNPPPELLRRQLDSIRAQTHRNWVCVISDDCSSPESFAALEEAVADDPRFVVSRSPERLHFYRNFERALGLAPAGADFVAMADQDDAWHPDKLETLLAEIGGAQLVYSDARIIDREGELISDTYWSIRRPNHDNLLSLLMANSVTGAASLFRRDLLAYALPFPPRQFSHFHDHWIGLVARVLGNVAFVERPLYDYVQHGNAVLGHAGANWMPPLRTRLNWLKKDPRERVRSWRLHYFVDCCRLMQFTTILEMRCGPAMSSGRRRSLRRFPEAERSPLALANLGRRAVRELLGESKTLGAEIALFFAFAWRRLVVAATRGLDRPRRRMRIDARTPMTLLPVPGRRDPSNVAVGTVGAKIAPLELAVRDDAPERVNILIPTIDLEHFFGGYITKLNLARRLAERGARVRIVTVDPVPTLPATWRQRLESYSGLEGVFDRVEVEFGRESQGLEVSRSDRFVASTWWTAHIARSALDSLDGGRFVYLIQEYEPFTFPMGTYAALATDSYRLPHYGVFSSELLRDYFRGHGIGVFAGGTRGGGRRLGLLPERDHGGRAAVGARSGPARISPAAVLRPSRASCRAEHVRARRAGAGPGGGEGRLRGGLGAARHRLGGGRAAPRARWRGGARAGAAPRAGGLRRRAARARRRPGVDVHAASQPRADRDGLGGDAHGDQLVREQDPAGDVRDLLQPDHDRAQPRWHRRRAGGGLGARGRARGAGGRKPRELEPLLARLVPG